MVVRTNCSGKVDFYILDNGIKGNLSFQVWQSYGSPSYLDISCDIASLIPSGTAAQLKPVDLSPFDGKTITCADKNSPLYNHLYEIINGHKVKTE